MSQSFLNKVLHYAVQSIFSWFWCLGFRRSPTNAGILSPATQYRSAIHWERHHCSPGQRIR